VASSAIGGPRRLEQSLANVEKSFKATQGSPSSSQHYSRASLIPLAQGYLAEAGIADYKFLQPTSADDKELAWEYTDGSRRTLSVSQPAAKLTITALLAKTIESDAGYCKGQYASGYMQPRYHLGSEIRKAYTACSDGPRTFAFYYSVVALPTGAIMRFGASSPPSQAQVSEALPRAERLEDAALKIISKPSAKR
jgi:hypothetical protein